MALTKSRGNMYPWVSHMWSPIKGCEFECPYCYARTMAKRSGQDYSVRLDEKDIETKLGKGRIIFVGHLCDMWGPWVPKKWIDEVLMRCTAYPDNVYVFQSKNPGRFSEFVFTRAARTLLGTTIETDRYPKGFQTKAPPIEERVGAMINLYPSRRFVTMEPIMDFDLPNLLRIIEMIRPEFVTIGADSKGHGLKEPDGSKVLKLIRGINEMKVEIRQKSNLERLLNKK